MASQPLTALPILPAQAAASGRAAARSRPAARGDMFAGRRKFVVATLSSMIAHCLLVIVLALLDDGRPALPFRPAISASFRSLAPPPISPLKSTAPVSTPEIGVANRSASAASSPIKNLRPQIAGSLGKRGDDGSRAVPRSLLNPGTMGAGDWSTPVGGSPYGMLDGRGDMKSGLLDEGGGTTRSEEAVVRGLRWLAAHQLDDGSWHFNHKDGGVCRYCKNEGNYGSTTASTGLALLPFLGAGHTHRHGDFQDTVRKGLDYLKKRMIATPLGGDLQEGKDLYSQAIGALALCEAYAMTRDDELRDASREAIRFIVNCQDKNGGGWRYFPGQVGDTSVTGWMLMALKSGQLMYASIPKEVWLGARKYLDGVQDDGGAAYGYQAPRKDEPAMTAVGLLCRMYDGWPRSQSALLHGVRSLSKRGPSQTDMYFNYYAAQVLRHYGGPEWAAFNTELREYLIASQGREGHESGSWYFPDQHGDQGGRLYNTAMAVMILEVYYRYMPIYGHRATSFDLRE